MIKNLKLFLFLALIMLHIPHTSHAEENNLAQTAVIGTLAVCGGVFLVVGSYKALYPTPIKHHTKTKKFTYQQIDFEMGDTPPRYDRIQITGSTAPYLRYSFSEIFKNVCVSATGVGMLYGAWKLAKDS